MALTLVLLGSFTTAAQAQYDEEIIRKESTAPGSAAPEAVRPQLDVPAQMPAIVDFEAMRPFETDGDTPNTFAIDPASISLQPNYALATIAARSPSGAVTIGYYGFACQHMQYRLMAYPGMGGKWQHASRRVQWQDVIDSETRNRQFRAVYKAACRLGGHSAPSVDDMLRHLREGRRQLPS